MKFIFIFFSFFFFISSSPCFSQVNPKHGLEARFPSTENATSVDCNNWLKTISANSFCRIGDVDVSGNQLTVEATINRTEPYLPGTGNDNEGDVVSKHTGPADINYLLRPNHAYITTTNGFFGTPDICEIQLNKTYHLAMVYNGSSLKFYRNGFLMSEVNATGNLILSDINTQIGLYDATFWNTHFLGLTNEVRIWNVARTQSEIRTYMNSSLPNPTTQTGLLAYYTFDNLLNKQGNPAWNGTLFNGASINNTNSSCSFIPDSCNVTSSLSCTGSLGEPIVNVTFSQGANPGPFLSTVVPGASTSYSYVGPVGTPPSDIVLDGNYAIINGIPSNPAWLQGGDHTNNGNGYMAFFNAAPDPGEFYRQTVTGLCPGTTYEFAAWILNAVNADMLPAAVSPNVSFAIFNPANLTTPITSFSTGDIATTNFLNWQRFSTLFTLPAGLNSVILTLSNNNVGGNALPGNDLAIDDITFRACGPLTTSSFSNTASVTSSSLCKNVPYTLYGAITDGLNAPAYQWQVSTNNGGTWTNIPGATSLNYIFGSGSPAGIYWYRLVSQEAANIGSANCKFYSNIINLTVNLCSGSSISNIINDYTPVIALNPCKNSITVENGTAYNVGDTVLLIQMKGALIDESNTSTFGNISDYRNSGNYEFNYVKNRTGNIIELKNKLTRQYNIPDGKVQLIRVPYYTSATISSTLTCLPWDGSKGGVVVLNVRDTVNMLDDINVNGKGFLGGTGFNSGNSALTCNENQYNYPSTSNVEAGLKGESIVTLTNDIVRGKGAPASGGGGGLGHNSGGGGGGNAGLGGFGGWQLDGCGSFPFDNRGNGGHSLTYNSLTNKIFMGGGGGAGNADNPGNTPPTGGDGGGIVIITANYLQSNNRKIQANGDSGVACTIPASPDCHDGMAGGGAGGAVLINVNQFIGNTLIEKKGGNGADMIATLAGGRIGPGGGGGGGMLFIKQATLPATVISVNSGGNNGVITQDSNDPYGATPGTDGSNFFNLVLPVDNVLFVPNIDSVRIKDSFTVCRNFIFNGFGYTNSTPVVSWEWHFGDATSTFIQNTTHTYSTAGTYNVTLIATDVNGCKDSIVKQVIVPICNNAISDVINDYTPVLALNPCNNLITVENASAFNAGDTVLLIQMKGAVIDSSNTNAFGNVTDYKNAGNYEFNFVKSKTGNIIELLNKLTRPYNIPVGKVQLIRVPYFTSTIVSSTLTCLPWDGAKGGVLAFNVRDTLTLDASIDVSAKGFRGGNSGLGFMCGVPEYSTASFTGFKGEGISLLEGIWSAGGGHSANGGGGSFGGNTGGGGGANLTNGGTGGKEYNLCSTLQSVEGKALNNDLNKKIYLGGGGGGGQGDNSFTVFPGGNGGGIAFISANHIKGNSFNINAKGGTRAEVINDEGGAGGGAGGSVILLSNDIINPLNIDTRGGDGNSNFNTTFTNDCHGPGAGGSGGAVFFRQPAILPNVTVNNAGGAAGIVQNPVSVCFNTTHGATNGDNGTNLFSFVLNRDTVLFVPNIDSVRIQSNATSCLDFNFNGLAYTNTSAIVNWEWHFGDGQTASTQNTTHHYTGTASPYTVHLYVTDINGCRDSITTIVNTNNLTANAGNDTAFCSNGPVTHVLHGTTNGTGFTWTPAGLLDNNTLQNPTATVSSTTTFYFTVPGPGGCNAIDSVKITVNPLPTLSTIADNSLCQGDSILLTTTSNATGFQWSPALSVNNAGIQSPYFTDIVSQQMIVTGTNNVTGCFKKDTVNITVKPIPIIQTISDTALCGPHNVVLNTSGGQTYSWSPATGLTNPAIANPIFNGTATQTYIVTGTAANACKAKDTVTITVNAQPVVNSINDITICRGDSLQLTTVSDATSNQWSPALSVNNPSITSPWFTDTISQQMIITGSNATGCFDKDTVNITVKPIPVVQTIPDTSMCGVHNIVLNSTGAQSYSWTPATGLSNPAIANPTFNGTATTTYIVTGTAANECKAKDTVAITINAQPAVSTIADISICKGDSIQLTTTSDAINNQWSPALSVNNSNIINPYFTDTVSQQMIITGSNPSGCFAKDTVNITIKPLPVVKTIADTSLCGPHNVTLTTNGGQTYSWLPVTSLDNPAIANPVFSGTATQAYIVTGTAANACKAKDTVTITINAVPAVSTIANIAICRNDLLQLNSSSNAETTSWAPALSVSNPSIVSPNFTDTVSQQMIITGTNTSTSCFSRDTVNVTVKPLPIVKTIKDTTTCTTNTITLFTSGAQTYSWTPATGLDDATATNPVFTGTGTNIYYVTGTAANGCIGKDTVQIIIGDKPVFMAPESKTICFSESVQLDGNNGSDYAYNWSPSTGLNNPSIVNPVANPGNSITYTLLITDHVCAYDSTFLVRVTVNPLPPVTASRSNDMDCATPQSQLLATGAMNYQWMPAENLSNANIDAPVASPYATTQYVVTGTDANGCVNKDTVTVVVKGSKYFGFNIPNSFTPNGDNLNDCFGITKWGVTNNFSLVIYNRWGEKVFETHNSAECWNGKYKGNPSATGNYVYYLTGETLCGKVTKKGNVLLIR